MKPPPPKRKKPAAESRPFAAALAEDEDQDEQNADARVDFLDVAEPQQVGRLEVKPHLERGLRHLQRQQRRMAAG